MSLAVAIALRAVARIPTLGCAGFEAFALPHSNVTYLAAANFWDGRDADMGAASTLFSLAPTAAGNLAAAPLQSFQTRGAHGFDYFNELLVVCNYYGCGSERGAASDACQSTVVYEHTGAGRFAELQRLATAGPAQTDHLLLSDGRVYLIVGENFSDEVCLFLQDPASRRFAKERCLAVPGAGATAAAEIDGFAYLVAASYHDQRTGWRTR